MDVIRHQAVHTQFHPFIFAPLGHQIQVSPVIIVAEKHLQPEVAFCRPPHPRFARPPDIHGKDVFEIERSDQQHLTLRILMAIMR